MIPNIEIYTITFLLTLALSFFVLFNDYSNRVNKLFFLLSISIAFWVLSNLLIDFFHHELYSLIFARVTIVWAALLPIFFNMFISELYFIKNEIYHRRNRAVLNISYATATLIILLSPTSLNVKSVAFANWGIDFEPGPIYYILLVYFIFSFGFSFIYLFKSIKNFDVLSKRQAKIILGGTSTAVAVGLITDVILPLAGYRELSSFGPFVTLIFLTFVAYTITKHRLFSIKIITIELATFGLWIAIAARAITAQTREDMLIQMGLLAVTVIFGVMLIRGALHEIKQRERIEELTDDLQRAYATINSTTKSAGGNLDGNTNLASAENQNNTTTKEV